MQPKKTLTRGKRGQCLETEIRRRPRDPKGIMSLSIDGVLISQRQSWVIDTGDLQRSWRLLTVFTADWLEVFVGRGSTRVGGRDHDTRVCTPQAQAQPRPQPLRRTMNTCGYPSTAVRSTAGVSNSRSVSFGVGWAGLSWAGPPVLVARLRGGRPCCHQ